MSARQVNLHNQLLMLQVDNLYEGDMCVAVRSFAYKYIYMQGIIYRQSEDCLFYCCNGNINNNMFGHFNICFYDADRVDWPGSYQKHGTKLPPRNIPFCKFADEILWDDTNGRWIPYRNKHDFVNHKAKKLWYDVSYSKHRGYYCDYRVQVLENPHQELLAKFKQLHGESIKTAYRVKKRDSTAPLYSDWRENYRNRLRKQRQEEAWQRIREKMYDDQEKRMKAQEEHLKAFNAIKLERLRERKIHTSPLLRTIGQASLLATSN